MAPTTPTSRSNLKTPLRREQLLSISWLALDQVVDMIPAEDCAMFGSTFEVCEFHLDIWHKSVAGHNLHGWLLQLEREWRPFQHVSDGRVILIMVKQIRSFDWCSCITTDNYYHYLLLDHRVYWLLQSLGDDNPEREPTSDLLEVFHHHNYQSIFDIFWVTTKS